MNTSKLCISVDAALAENLGASLPPKLRAHSVTCQRCQDEVTQVSALAERLHAYKESSVARAGDIDLGPKLLARLNDKPATWRSWRRLALAASLGVLVLGILSLRSSSTKEQARLSALQGAELRVGNRSSKINGHRSQSLPFAVATSGEQSAEVTLAKSTLHIHPSTELKVTGPSAYDLLRGVIAVESHSEITLLTTPQQGRIRLHGHASIEHQPESHHMKLLKHHKIIAASAVVALVLYSGWATLSDGEQETRVIAPGGVYLDGDGKAHTFDPQSGSSTEDLLAIAKLGSEGHTGHEEEAAAFAPAGAFWSEEDQVVQFRIRGEAFDADTGQPVDAFELVASPIDSKDFAQSGAVTRSFRDLNNGEFTLDGIGLGTWRVTASREGYAPVIQNLDIADMRATPYLVIPLSSSGAQITGRVIDWQGRPVAGAKIGINDCIATKKKSCNIITSDANGGFILDKLPEEEVYSLYAKHERYGFATSKNMRSLVEEDAAQHITIQLSGVLRIYGRVMKGAKDTPVSGAQIAGGGGQTKSSASGDYEMIVPLEEAPEAHVVSYPGSAKKLAIHSYPMDRSVRRLEWVNAPTYAAQVRIDFHLEMSSASLVGQILDQEGRPQSGLELQLQNTNGWKRGRTHQTFPTLAITDALGNYRVDNIPEGAGYMILYRASEHEDWNELGYVNIEEEREVRADFQIGTGTIRGRFVSAESGAPMAVADMSCSRLGAERVGRKGVFQMAHCYPDGRFEIVGLMPGSYQLHSKVEWMDSSVTFRTKTVELTAGQLVRDVEVEVEGEGAKVWRFRILSKQNAFLAGPYIRYQIGSSNTTANLNVGDDGIASQQIDDSVDEIYLEVPGYQPSALHLRSLDNAKVHEVHLEKLKEN